MSVEQEEEFRSLLSEHTNLVFSLGEGYIGLFRSYRELEDEADKVRDAIIKAYKQKEEK